MSKFGPTHCVTSNVDNWAPYYVQRVKMALDGTWQSTDTWGGLAAGLLSMPTFNAHTPEKARTDGMNALEAVKSGARHPFDGPVVDQSGATKVAAGANMPDQEIAGLNWYVQGVEGDLRH
jgi:simple sugar transport system substrate-binding protein